MPGLSHQRSQLWKTPSRSTRGFGSEIQRSIASGLSAGARKPQGLPMGEGGASQVAITLSTIMNAAVDDQLIGRNPLKAQSVKVPKQPRSKAEPWTPDQVRAVRAGLPARWQAVADCGAGLGLRQGEIFGLAVGDVDFLRRKVHVRRQVKRVGNRAWFALPKGGKEPTVPLAQHVTVALAQHIEQHPAAEVTLPWNEPRNPRKHGKPAAAALLFTARDRSPLIHSTFNTTAWTPARKGAGITTGGLHVLRHTFASVMLAGGVDIKALSEYLGHHDPAVTLRIYAHLMPTAEGRALRAIEAAFAEADVPMTAQDGEKPW